MRNLEEVLLETKRLYGRIDSILKLSIYDKYGDLSGLEVDYQDGNSFSFWRS